MRKALLVWYCGVGALGLAPVSSGAATFAVDTLADAVDANPGDGLCATAEGACSLRAAIQETNALAGADTVTVPAGTYVLALAGAGEDLAATGDLDILDDLTVEGAGMGGTTVDGAGLDRVFDVGPSVTELVVEIRALTVRGGRAPANTPGGGVFNREGNRTRLAEVSLEANTASGTMFDLVGGGGAANYGCLEIVDSEVRDNRAFDEAPDDAVYGGGLLTARNFGTDNTVCANSGLLEVIRTRVVDNAVVSVLSGGASFGGGISGSAGDIRLIESVIAGNRIEGGSLAEGGGIQAFSTALTLDRTRVDGNRVRGSSASGGGIHFSGEDLIPVDQRFRADRSVIARNVVESTGTTSRGAGLLIWSDAAGLVESSTISGNSIKAASGNLVLGEGLYSRAFVQFDHCTLAFNEGPESDPSASGLFVASGAIAFHNSIIADKCDSFEIEPTVSNGFNIESGDTCGLTDPTDRPNTDPLLGPLGDHGGDTLTHLPLPGSPAIDTGDAENCPAVDQRGAPRDDGACDVGAVEVGPQDEAAGILILVVEGRPEGVGYTVGDATSALRTASGAS